MESTSWKQIGAEFEARGEARGMAEGERKVLTLLLDKRLGDRARCFVERLQAASTPRLEQVAELLAEHLAEEQLLAALEALLPETAAGE